MTSDPRPVWLLDVDGVVNAPRSRPWEGRGAWPREEWRVVDVDDSRGRSFTITAAGPVLAFLRRVHDDGLVEVRWHSTWQWDASLVGAALGLPAWPVQPAPEAHRVGEFLRRDLWWRWPAAARVLLEGRRLAWADDDIEHDLTVEQGAFLRGCGALLISPDPAVGLTARHLRRVERWLGVSDGA